MLDGTSVLPVNLPLVGTISVKIKATGDSKFNDSPEYSHFVEQR